MLIDEAKKQKKPYGYYFKTVTSGFTFTGEGGSLNSFNVTPIEVYRVYVDGKKDELVRGVDLIGTPLSMFSNITAASNSVSTFTGACGTESGWVPVTAQVRSNSGVVMGDNFYCVFTSDKELDEAALCNEVVEFAERMVEVKDAEPVGDYYIGPMMFEGDAVPLAVADGETPETSLGIIKNGILEQLVSGRTPSLNCMASTANERFVLDPNRVITTASPRCRS